MMMQSYRHMLETERVTYDGRVAILWPAQDAWVIPHIGPTVGWSGIAPNAYVQIVPGGHITCVTDHVADLGRMLATIVD
jgi:hypothetical protein